MIPCIATKVFFRQYRIVSARKYTNTSSRNINIRWQQQYPHSMNDKRRVVATIGHYWFYRHKIANYRCIYTMVGTNKLQVICDHNSLNNQYIPSSQYRSDIHQQYKRMIPMQQQQEQHKRLYHTTYKQEIVPLIAVAAILAISVRYSYRAIQRMRIEQEEYQYELQLYERQQMMMKQHSSESGNDIDNDDVHSKNNHHQTMITLAIDFGSCYMKLAAGTYQPTSPITIQISREGDRSIFNGIVVEEVVEQEQQNDNNTTTTNQHNKYIVKASGRTALERYYFPKTMQQQTMQSEQYQSIVKQNVILPLLEFTSQQHIEMTDDHNKPSLQQIITYVIQDRIHEVINRIRTSSISIQANVVVRHVITIPSMFTQNDTLRMMYENTFIDICKASTNEFHDHMISFIPEPIATIWGAQYCNLLPSISLSKDVASIASYCIIDIGGHMTQISIVQNDRIINTSTILWGGETLVEQLVLLLKQQAITTENTLNDIRSLALLQYHARQAVMELSNQTRVSIHVPYLFANPLQHHLDTNISRNVLNQTIEDYINIPNDISTSEWIHDDTLSPHLPKPNNLTSLWTSILTHILDRSQLVPNNISAILLVGGGSKSTIIRKSVNDAWDILTGGSIRSSDNNTMSSSALINIDTSLVSELTVIGAASLPPSFDYSMNNGLVRRK